MKFISILAYLDAGTSKLMIAAVENIVYLSVHS
jgi:hypothetical protein